MHNGKRIFIVALGVWLTFMMTAVTVLNLAHPVLRAILEMAWGVIVLWIVLGGGLMYRFRTSIKNVVLKAPLQWQVKFALLATLLALLEEKRQGRGSSY